MEIVIVWSWFSFFAGMFATLVVGFSLILATALKQWKKQRDAAVQSVDSVEKMFAAWGGRDNGNLK